VAVMMRRYPVPVKAKADRSQHDFRKKLLTTLFYRSAFIVLLILIGLSLLRLG
jgi:hypothetical protein